MICEKVGAGKMRAYYRVRQTVLLLIALSVAALGLTNCLTDDRHVWSYYDECASQTSFIAMVECGKQKELAACSKGNPLPIRGPFIPHPCSPPAERLAFNQYTDALVLAVKNNEM